MNSTPLQRGQLASIFSSGCKPPEQWRIGTEHEKIGFCVDTLRPIPYDGERSIRNLLQALISDELKCICEEGQPIALARKDASITLEPGGQLELSGAPLACIHHTHAEIKQHYNLLYNITKELGIGFLGLGFQPKWSRDDIPWMPKARYNVMKQYMPKAGGRGLDMMLRTATVQANLDFSDEADMRNKMRIGSCLQPAVTALFASSPFEHGKPSGLLSTRAACWLDTDPNRTGIPPCVFDDDFGFESYTEWLLDVPMYFIVRDGRYIDCSGESFRAFMDGKLPQLPGEHPTLADWQLHSTTAFPEVRLKNYLEMRGADSGPWHWVCALPALWKGLLYDPQALEACRQLTADWRHDEVMRMRNEVPRLGFDTSFRDNTIHHICEQMLDIALAGLNRLNCLNSSGKNESIYLAPLIEAVGNKATQAEKWLAAYHGPWKGNIDPIFEEAMHRFDL